MPTVNEKNHPLLSLRGVGPQTVKQLARLSIHTLQDLLFHLPSRYQNRAHVQSIRELRVDQEAVIEGMVIAIEKPLRGRTKLICLLQDHTGKITLRFFHAFKFQSKALQMGAKWRCYGRVRLGMKGWEMSHPEFRLLEPNQPAQLETHLTPTYPTTEGLSQYQLRKLTGYALAILEKNCFLPEYFPAEWLQSFDSLSLADALQFLHKPPLSTPLDSLANHQTVAHRRLIIEELIAHRLSLLRLKEKFQAANSFPLPDGGKLKEAFLKQLPFTLTQAQQRVVTEIKQDLTRSQPMLRLVQGDVGSGKTVVAAIAALQAIENHYQVALMAPTALLAEQHYRVFKSWLTPLNIDVQLLTGSIKGRARQALLADLAAGTLPLVIGTHALFQAEVNFQQLGLVIVDEQHRFGVEQRAQLRDKGTTANSQPHQLIMTATPIPRTLAMSFYANVDCSIIDELPPGRTPIHTTVLAASKRHEVIARVRDACCAGRQAYWVCSLIEESEVLTYEAAIDTAQQLQRACPTLKIGLIHGRMPSTEKEAVMQAFLCNAVHVLVATTVIEVGVDVPNASIMVIENAERLGLSQLHQLRGRVGRGSVASFCLLLYGTQLSNLAKERLQVIRDTTDGFKIAERDLVLRGPGEMLGTQQTGDITFCFADLLRDSDLLPEVHAMTDLLQQKYPDLISPLMKRWVVQQQDYSKV